MITNPSPCNKSPEGAIAVVGMGCRFPQATGIAEFQRLLTGNVDAITAVPEDRFEVAKHYHPLPGTPGKTISRYGGFLPDVFGFDAAFFGISPLEARGMDPQQRLLLQVVWESLEDAGIRPSSLAGSRTGVFVGQATAEYGEVATDMAHTDIREAAGNRLRAVTAGRISYALDLHGPSLVLDAACSSSLVAVNTARRSLLTEESDLAIAAGVNIVLSVTDSVAYSQASMLAADGRCKFGDASADGFVRSDGIGVVVLKRLADAERDGDPVHALLAGSAVVNDGRGSGLLLQPAASGQAAALREACRSAGITPGQLDYVEAHGTGTQVGDSIELNGLAEAMAGERTGDRPLKVGSVKSNVGHTEAAAGIAGLIKAVLIARDRLIPASLHVNVLNPLLTEGGLPIEIVRQNEDLKPAGNAALLGVSSFGIAGTNAHVIVSEHVGRQTEPPQAGTPTDEPHLLVLTARSMRSLRRLAYSYATYLEPGGSGRTLPLRDICATAATRRDHHACRLWVVGTSPDELALRLRALADGEDIADGGIAETGFSGPKRIAFVFPGQGSQWLGMGRGLLASSPAFREAMSACDRAVQAETGRSVIDVLTRGREEDLHEIDVVQPVLWAFEIALAAHWQQMGVRPDLCIGHSMGEAAAAYVCGALSLTDSAAVICRRSRLMKRLAGRGAMLAVGVPTAEAHRIAAEHGSSVCVAVENSPHGSVLAGDSAAIGSIEQELVGLGQLARRVKVSVASHSPDMDLIRDELLVALANLNPGPGRLPMLSTVTGTSVRGPELTGAYWADNLRRTVRFLDGVRTAAEDMETVFVEVSPHPVLTHAIEETQTSLGMPESAVPSLLRDQDEAVAMARALGQAFIHGATVDWRHRAGGATRHVPLPMYPWDEKCYRNNRTVSRAPQTRTVPLGLSTGAVSVHGLAPVPPAAVFGATLEATRSMTGGTFSLDDVRLDDTPHQPSGGGEITLHIAVDTPDHEGARPFTVEAHTGVSGPTALRARGRLQPLPPRGLLDAGADLDAVLARCRSYLSADEFRELTRRWGYEVDEEHLRVTRLWLRPGGAVAKLQFPQAPPVLAAEAGLLPLLAALPQPQAGAFLYVPTAFRRVAFYGALTAEMWSLSRFSDDGGRRPTADVRLLDEHGYLLAEFRGIGLRRLPVGLPRLRRTKAGAFLATLLSADAGLGENRAERRVAAPAPSTAFTLPRQRTSSKEPARPTDVQPSETTADALLRCVADVMGTTPEDIEVRRSLRDQGFDSLMGITLKKLLMARTGTEIGIGRILGNETVAQLRDEYFTPLADARV
ncbi:acyltransferase domain-containing protein [Streptomyces violascens]|uniref:acyltransferase domain-containing protein n=1 Tax=Streptomyces violascens TaxID=67381 RepID=UPI0036A41DB6